MDISVIIPTYKKTDMFMANLEHNLPYLKNTQIIVVNDDPHLSIAQSLSRWPEIILIENSTNLGFAGAVNKGIEHVNNSYVMLLNTDVKLNDTSYTTALSHFSRQPNIFAISFAQIEKNGETVGKNRIFWKNGFFQHGRATDLVFGETGWAEGGSCIIDVKKYREIGGFDSIYSPFYWEDIDLSYRAWKQGYRVLFDPSILVEHHHESTIKSFFSSMFITSIAYRNQLLFIWKNIQDNDLRSQHTIALIKQLLRSITTDPAFISGYIRALMKKRDIMNSVKSLRTDHEILAQFTK
ncbi:glycosyltransferase family 2 protein [Candidatus Woesebacteria bacterium]|nr:glycosyltransferase family 2 protein [Candidatus Woesebacteria bacterium]